MARRQQTRKKGDGSLVWVAHRGLWRFTDWLRDEHGQTVKVLRGSEGAVAFSPDGKPVRVAGEAKDALEAERRQRLNAAKWEVRLGLRDPDELDDNLDRGKDYTLNEWLRVWLERKTDIRDSTRVQYERNIRIHLTDSIGPTRLRLLTTKTLRTFFEDTLPNKANPRSKTGATLAEGSTVRHLYWTLNGALEQARIDGLLFKNPLEGVSAPQKKGIDHRERDAVRNLYSWVGSNLMELLENSEDKARWALAFYGLRQSEVLGLTDDCIRQAEFPSGAMVLVIKQQLKKKHQEHGCDWVNGAWSCGAKVANRCPMVTGERGVFIDDTTKTEAGVREIYLDNWLDQILDEQLDKQRKLRGSKAFQPESGYKMDSLLFTDKRGRARRHTADNAAWHAMLEESNIYKFLRQNGYDDSLRPHLARHITASFLLSRGFTAEQIKALTGWSSGEMIRVYRNAGSSTTKALSTAIGGNLKKGNSKQISWDEEDDGMELEPLLRA